MLEGTPADLEKWKHDLVPSKGDRCGDVAPDSAKNLTCVTDGGLALLRVCGSEDIKINKIFEKREADNDKEDKSDETLFLIVFLH